MYARTRPLRPTDARDGNDTNDSGPAPQRNLDQRLFNCLNALQLLSLSSMLSNRKPARSKESSTPEYDTGDGSKPVKGNKFGSNWLSSQSAFLLIFGVLLGYVVLPMALIESGDYVAKNDIIYDNAENHLRHLGENDIEARLLENQRIMSSQSLPTITAPNVMHTAQLSDHRRKKVMVTGGAGFVGSHLVDKLMKEGHEVTVVDNFFTGQKKNIAHWLHHPNFNLVVHDVTEPFHYEIDEIYHLACPASPPHYQFNPVKTIKTSTMGTLNMLGLAKRVRAKILLTSTSEIYGDPQQHPQREDYWGNVNTIGPRACYDEGKRVAETMMYSYKHQNNVEIRVARIFNTFGPRMHPNDGRVVSNFIIQALQNKPMTIYGQGEQTRSFQYVSDLVDGLHALMNGNYDGPVNLGNPDEYSVKQFADYIKDLTKSDSEIKMLEKTQDDPSRRRPDISRANQELGWSPKVKVEDGLKSTIAYFKGVLDAAGEIIPTGPGASKPQN